MTPNDRRLWLDLMTTRYLEAVEGDDFDAQARLWELAAADPELEAAFHDVHDGLNADRQAADATAVADAAERHLTSGTVVRPADGPVTVGMVADELFRHAPDRLSAAAHALNDRLRAAADPLPDVRGLTRLVAWAEARFGPAPAEYWAAFHQAVLDLRLRHGAADAYALAARRAPKSGGGP